MSSYTWLPQYKDLILSYLILFYLIYLILSYLILSCSKILYSLEFGSEDHINQAYNYTLSMTAERLSKLRQMMHQILCWMLNQMFRVLRCWNRRRERLTILRYTHTEEERSWKYCFANHIYFCSCFCSVLCSCLLLQPLSSFTCLLQCNAPEFCILWDLSQKIMSYKHTTIQFYNGRTTVYWLLSLIMQKRQLC